MKNIIFKLSILMFAAVLMFFAAASDADGCPVDGWLLWRGAGNCF